MKPRNLDCADQDFPREGCYDRSCVKATQLKKSSVIRKFLRLGSLDTAGTHSVWFGAVKESCRKVFQSNKKLMKIAVVTTLLLPGLAMAALNLELTKGINAKLPIAVLPFSQSNLVGRVIDQDLQLSGHFKIISNLNFSQFPKKVSQVKFSYWQKFGLNALVIGSVQNQGGQYKVSYSLINLFKSVKGSDDSAGVNTVLASDSFIIPAGQLHQAAHQIANQIYGALTGQQGFFTTRIAYINKSTTKPIKYNLMTSDFDGAYPKTLLSSAYPIASPVWSPDHTQLAYVLYQQSGQAALYVMNVQSKTTKKILSAQGGLISSPAWSPSGSQLAVVLAKGGSPQIYLMNADGSNLQQLTSGFAINTNPSWAPDAESIVFTSNRNGSPQLYSIQLDNNKITQLTTNGNYSAAGQYARVGKQVVYLNGAAGSYNVALLNLANSQVQQLSNSNMASSPSFSANGQLVLYSSYYDGQARLFIRNIASGELFALPAANNAQMLQPNWS
jgi:TolB protein